MIGWIVGAIGAIGQEVLVRVLSVVVRPLWRRLPPVRVRARAAAEKEEAVRQQAAAELMRRHFVRGVGKPRS